MQVVTTLLEVGLSHRYSRNLSLDVGTPTPAASTVHLTFSSCRTSAFPKTQPGRRLAKSLQQLQKWVNFGAAVFVNAFQPPALLATQAVLTIYPLYGIGHRGFYARAHRSLLPPYVPGILIIRTGQLMIADFHRFRFRALMAAPVSPDLISCGSGFDERRVALNKLHPWLSFGWRRPVARPTSHLTFADYGCRSLYVATPIEIPFTALAFQYPPCHV